MKKRVCPHCRQEFTPGRFHPEQVVCSFPQCQRRRRNEYHRRKIAADPAYRELCEDKGPLSWKAEALGTAADVAEYHYDPGFLTTRWKYFHDALQLHRLTILHDILPKYGICSG
jgi:hypothetical protein